ncbi:SH3 domain-containing protein [Nitrosovibrio tenuis]|uniref:SH3 domain-containing protein n=1 Tax=Nitrosovibrio tenuis TaxID=1233 RepID=A0A1H7GTM7_9PROT|nr:SH3 domain-containing protein [Nitrosovibrio tenuis]SEK40392.1 SH3 domain-containing protein [Nitrosovibrio tenuis]
MGSFKKLRASYKSLTTPREHMPGRVIVALLGLSMAGCNILPKEQSPAPEPEISVAILESRVKEQYEIERGKLLAEKEAQQQEIERLQKLLAEKDTYIRSQQARQQDQAKTLQQTSSQAAHAQVKLRRLATRPAAASTIAEAEIFIESLQSSPMISAEQLLQNQARRLLEAATALYAVDNYAAAMDYAAQAREFIDMLKNNRTRKAADQISVSLQTPIPLRAAVKSNLRQKPGLQYAVLGILAKDTTMIAEAYHGDWLQVQTADGRSGWVLNTLVEAQIAKP